MPGRDDGFDFSFDSKEEKLPVYMKWESISEAIRENPFTVIVGSTGCGKSTLVPQLILRDKLQNEQKECKIIVTQPRRLAAISIAQMVCNSRNWALGTICGYQIGRDRECTEDTILQYVTTNILVERIIHRSDLRNYTHIIVDEIHERTQEMDCLFYLLKTLRSKLNPELKIILMSATTESSLYRRYFGEEMCSEVQIEGRNYNVRQVYLEGLPPVIREQITRLETKQTKYKQDYLYIRAGLVDIVYDLICTFDETERGSSRGAVLIFVPGIGDVRSMIRAFERKTSKQHFVYFPLHSKVPIEDQRKAFRSVGHSQRKIIVATNVAESSITVPDIKHVIDFCLTKHQILDLKSGFASFVTEYCSKANCDQRAGRAGRTQDGTVYRLVKQVDYLKFPEFTAPEILRSPIDVSVLKIKQFGLNDPQTVLANFITPPSNESVKRSIVKLKEAQALQLEQDGDVSLDDGEITILGRVMASLPLDIQLSKLIMMGYAFGCFEECIKIAACYSVDEILANDNDRMKSYKNQLKWARGTFSDPISVLNAFDEYLSAHHRLNQNLYQERSWADANGLSHRRLLDAYQMYVDLQDRLRNIGIEQPHAPNFKERDPSKQHFFILIAICGAFYPNYYVQHEISAGEATQAVGSHDPKTTLVLSGLPSGYGFLYAQYIRAALKDLIQGKYELTFKDIDAFISLKGDPSKERRNGDTKSKEGESSSFPYDLYICEMFLKMNTCLKVPRIPEETANQLLKELKVTNSHDEDIFFKIKPPQNVLDRPPLPSQQEFSGIITRFVDLLTFYVQLEERSSELKTLENEIEDQMRSEGPKALRDPTVDDLVLAVYERHYRRARVIKIEEKIKVFFIDYGNIENVNQVFVLSRGMLMSAKEPPFAYRSQLACVETLDGAAGQPTIFELLCEGIPCKLKVSSTVDDILKVDVYVEMDDIPYHLNEKLARDKSALYIGKKPSSAEESEILTDGSDKYEIIGDFFAPPSDKEAGYHELYGPRSPLSNPRGFEALTKPTQDSVKTIEVTRESVNQVFFGETSYHKRFLVSSSARLTNDKKKLQLMRTSLMPKSPMMLPFVSLIFCPRAEFHVNKDGTTYTGAICGMGGKLNDENVVESLYPMGDIEVEFSNGLSKKGASMVNVVRRLLNEAFCGNNEFYEWSWEPILRIQEKLADLTLRFFNLPECVEAPVGTASRPKPRFQWGLLDKENMEQVAVCSKRALYKPHPTAMIRNRDMVELLTLCSSFMEAALDYSAARMSMCPLCLKFFDKRSDVADHLDETEHKEIFARLKGEKLDEEDY